MLSRDPELLVPGQTRAPRGRLPSDRADARRVRVAQHEQKQRIAALEQRVDVSNLDRVRVRLVEKTGSPGVVRIDEEMLPDETLELDRVLGPRVRGNSAV